VKGRIILGALGALAIVTPGALAKPGGNPPTDSCGLGKPGSQELRADPARPGASEIRDYPPNLCRGNQPVPPATAAQAGTITLRNIIERVQPRTIRQVDADHNHTNSPGDYFSGVNTLWRGRRQVGTLRFKSTITALSGSQITVHDVMTIRLRGGHLYVDRTEAGDTNEQEQRGDSETYPIVRGDGRYAGYTGQLVAVTARTPSPTRPPFWRDTITLSKQGPQA
jgi:hypothetical protein